MWGPPSGLTVARRATSAAPNRFDAQLFITPRYDSEIPRSTCSTVRCARAGLDLSLHEGILERVNTKPPASRRHLSRSPFSAQPERPVEEFELGDRVTHAEHGLGRVVAQESAAVTVDFGSHRTRIAHPFPRLRKL